MSELRFPLFVDLKGKKAVVIGAGTVGMRRAQVLQSFGAQVTVFDPGVEDEMVCKRLCTPEDLVGAYLCVIATSEGQSNQTYGQWAREAGAMVNVADDPQNCDFFFPAICQGDTLVAGVVGQGQSHSKTAQVAQRIRQVILEIENEGAYDCKNR